MAVAIRLARQGGKGNPEYLVVAADKEGKRDGRYLQRIGYYFPKKKTLKEKVQMDWAAFDQWIKKGAQPTDTVSSLAKQWKASAAS